MTYLRIVIPAKNEEKYLPKLLDSIRNQSFKDLEIIVADAGSKDKTGEIAQDYGCKIVEGGHPAIGRNNGVRGCKAPVVCFIDSDIVLPNDYFLERALTEFNERKLDVAGTLMKPISVGNCLKDFLYLAGWYLTNAAFCASQHTRKPLMQSVMFARREVHNSIKGFPHYEFGEDSAYAEKAVKMGYKFGILASPGKAQISMRRFEKNGIFKMLGKYAYFDTGRMLGHEFELGKTRIGYF